MHPGEDPDFKIDKVEDHGVLERQAMVVTLKEESMVRKTFAIGVKSKNDRDRECLAYFHIHQTKGIVRLG